jgi:hypothetical protein
VRARARGCAGTFDQYINAPWGVRKRAPGARACRMRGVGWRVQGGAPTLGRPPRPAHGSGAGKGARPSKGMYRPRAGAGGREGRGNGRAAAKILKAAAQHQSNKAGTAGAWQAASGLAVAAQQQARGHTGPSSGLAASGGSRRPRRSAHATLPPPRSSTRLVWRHAGRHGGAAPACGAAPAASCPARRLTRPCRRRAAAGSPQRRRRARRRRRAGSRPSRPRRLRTRRSSWRR